MGRFGNMTIEQYLQRQIDINVVLLAESLAQNAKLQEMINAVDRAIVSMRKEKQ